MVDLALIEQLAKDGANKVIETHISWVILESDRVIKVKKPVDFGFLNFSSLELRKAACEAEVRLNRRLAPDVYLGVLPVREGDGGPHLGDTGRIIEYAVLMKRLPDEQRADHLLSQGELGEREIRAAAEVLGRFHEEAARGPHIDAYGTAEAVAVSIAENFDQTRFCLSDMLSFEEAEALERWQTDFVINKSYLFEQRITAKRVCEGHGDLRLDHLYFDSGFDGEGQVRILDGIEFSERLRYLDVTCDVTFLAMDLGAHGRTDLAERFLALYAETTGDYDLYSMADFYESYRAFVRGKIACFVVSDPSFSLEVREHARRQARRHFRMAVASELRSLLPPCLVGVAGLIASGKSTVAHALAQRTGAPVVSSDRTRKQMAGIAPVTRLQDSGFSGAYRASVTEEVYTEVLRRAEVVLRSGRSVIIDASFRSNAHRARLFALGARVGVPVRLVECRVSREVALARLEKRALDPTAVSDGRKEIWDDFAARFEPISELAEDVHIVLDTESSLSKNLSVLSKHVPMWPQGLVD